MMKMMKMIFLNLNFQILLNNGTMKLMKKMKKKSNNKKKILQIKI